MNTTKRQAFRLLLVLTLAVASYVLWSSSLINSPSPRNVALLPSAIPSDAQLGELAASIARYLAIDDRAAELPELQRQLKHAAGKLAKHQTPSALSAQPRKAAVTKEFRKKRMNQVATHVAAEVSAQRILCLMPVHSSGMKQARKLAVKVVRLGCDAVMLVSARTGTDNSAPGDGEIISVGSDAKSGGPQETIKHLILDYKPHRVQRYEDDTTGRDTTKNQFQKTHHMFIYLANHQSFEQYDWFVKLDTDTVFLPANFRRLARGKFDTSAPTYLGHRLPHFPYESSDERQKGDPTQLQ